MDLFDVCRSCVRRWYIFCPIVLIGALFAYHAYTSTKPVYYSNAVVGIAAPSSQVVQASDGFVVPRNGLLDSGGATLITNMAALALRDSSTIAQVVAAGGAGDYIARMFPGPENAQPLPLIMIEASEPDPELAIKTVDTVVTQSQPVLRDLQQQAGVPIDQMVTSLTVSPPSAPVAGTPSRMRTTIVIVAIGLAVGILVAVGVDVILLRRKHAIRRSLDNRKYSTVSQSRDEQG